MSKRTKIVGGAIALSAAGAVVVAGASIANASGNTATPATTSTSGTGSTGSGAKDGKGGKHTVVTGAEATKVGDAVKAKYSGTTIDKVLKDSDGSYDVLATTSGQRARYEVSKYLKTISKDTRGPGDHRGGGRHGTEVTGTEATKVGDAVKAKYSGTTIDKVFKDEDGSYDVLATTSGQRVHYEVSKDLKTISKDTRGPGGRGPGGGHGGAPSGAPTGSATSVPGVSS